jgi:hypothetical protein
MPLLSGAENLCLLRYKITVYIFFQLSAISKHICLKIFATIYHMTHRNFEFDHDEVLQMTSSHFS